MKLIRLRKSEKPGKKYDAVLETDQGREKTVSFGDASMKDYTLHPASIRDERKEAYLARHAAREDWNDPTTAGFWSRHILWNKPTVAASLADTKRKYNL